MQRLHIQLSKKNIRQTFFESFLACNFNSSQRLNQTKSSNIAYEK